MDTFIPQDYGFDIAFSLNVDLDPSYGFYKVTYVDSEVVNSTRKKTKTVLDLETCGGKHF